ncbi:hypothetical protein, partial [uncultured Acinetobacter sp.]|uniref:hypothetical protein n=1 Tax=uncultured Acinetobacter sp. TaxID=165433 RepID=UPI00262EC348
QGYILLFSSGHSLRKLGLRQTRYGSILNISFIYSNLIHPNLFLKEGFRKIQDKKIPSIEGILN